MNKETATQAKDHFPGRVYVQKNVSIDKPETSFFQKVKETHRKKRTREKAWSNTPTIKTFSMEEFIIVAEGNHSILKVAIDNQMFELIKKGKLEVLVVKPSYLKSIKKKLYSKSGMMKMYDMIQMSVGYGNTEKITAKYRGFFYSKSNHTIKVGTSQIPVVEGTMIIKFGSENEI